jgi:Ribbon-helix-helix protein, copG family
MARRKAGKKLNTSRSARGLGSPKKRATRSLGSRSNDGAITVPAFTRSPNGQGRIRVALRVKPEELEALDLLAERWGVSFSEATRQLIQDGLEKEKLITA